MYELKVNRNDTKSLKILLWFWVYKLEVKYFDFKFKNGYVWEDIFHLDEKEFKKLLVKIFDQK